LSAAAARRPPGFAAHLVLLWGLRLTIGLNRGKGNSRAIAVAAFLASSAPGLVLGLAFYALLVHPAVASSRMWPDFLLALLCFVTSAVWATWPILSAGVDDHSEISRYSSFPISPFRLMLASTMASLFEPRAIVFYAPLAGTVLGYARLHPFASWPFAAVLFTAYALFNATLSRVGLHAVLNVLRQQRSAELIGGFFVVLLICCSFIPPIDTSWLLEAGGAATTLSDQVLYDSAVALQRSPTGFLAHGLARLGRGTWRAPVADLFALVEMTIIGLVVAYGLLLQFHRHVGRGGAASSNQRESNPFATTKDLFRVLVIREALDLWNNARARLLASVPFLLAILLKLLSGRDLFVFLLGKTADAWLLGGLCLYGGIVIASTFSQNTFGYDGHGFSVFLVAPVDLALVVKAKNLVHAAAAGALALAVSGFYLVYFGHGGFLDWACAMAAVAGVVPVLLAAGNFLSLYFPVKFHATLKRRDKLPFAASMLGVAAASVGTAPFGWALQLQGKEGASGATLALLVLSAALGWVAYRALLPSALRLLVARRELVLRAVTRD
jgi:ABC-2 type transport system permease protein